MNQTGGTHLVGPTRRTLPFTEANVGLLGVAPADRACRGERCDQLAVTKISLDASQQQRRIIAYQLVCSAVDGMQGLSSTETSSLGLLSIVCISVLVNAWRSDGEPLFASLAISGLAFAFAYAVIQWTGDVFMRRGFKGKDLSKKNPVEM